MARIKKRAVTTIESREDLEGVYGEYAAQVIEADRLTVAMEKRIAKIREAYEEPLAAAKAAGDALFADLQAWAALHPEAFGEQRSIELLHGTLGFRTCPPKVSQAAGVKVGHTLAALRAKGMGQFVRVREDIDKEAVLSYAAAARERGPEAAEQAAAELAAVGLKLTQGEVFYCDPKREGGGL